MPSWQNRIGPKKIPWPCRKLNREPTASEARTLPVCHITPGKKIRMSLGVCVEVMVGVCGGVCICFVLVGWLVSCFFFFFLILFFFFWFFFMFSYSFKETFATNSPKIRCSWDFFYLLFFFYYYSIYLFLFIYLFIYTFIYFAIWGVYRFDVYDRTVTSHGNCWCLFWLICG